MIFERKEDGEGVATPANGSSSSVRPKRGCRRFLLFSAIALLLVIGIALFVGYRWVATEHFANVVRSRVIRTLEFKTGRKVTIGSVTVTRGVRPRIVIRDLRISNVPGGRNKYFATVGEVELSAGLTGLLQGAIADIEIGTVFVRDPHLFFEVYPEGFPFEHNFPKWRQGEPPRFQTTKIDLKKLYASGGAFDYLDLRRDMQISIAGLSSEVDAKYAQQIYTGVATSPTVTFRIKEYDPFQLDLRSAFRYAPGVLEFPSVALRGKGIEAFLTGKLDPVTEPIYAFSVRSRIDLARVRQIVALEKDLRGLLSMDGTLRGHKGEFLLSSAFTVPRLNADVYEVSDLRGQMNVNDENMGVSIRSGRYGGGSIAGEYRLANYAEPYPMFMDLDYDRVSLEKLFSDWGVRDTGLRGAATGNLVYSWNEDKLLEGTGEGRATLRPGAVAFGNAKYPMPLSGASRFALNKGIITFAPSNLRTQKSDVRFSGKLAIEDLYADLKVQIQSADFSELDRLAYNFALSADEKDYELLGLGGTGTIDATVKGTFKKPDLQAAITSTGTKYNDVLLGAADIALRYDGPSSVLTFDRGEFRDGGGTLTLLGTVAFPEQVPGPRFDLNISTSNWPVDRAMDVVNLELEAQGSGTGRLEVHGTPDDGVVTFHDLMISRDDSRLRLNGDVDWNPGEGNIAFNLDIGAESFPVTDLIAFFEFGAMPVTGKLTGTLHLEGPKDELEGAGSIVVRDGVLYGEPIELATADLLFTEGLMRASHLEIRFPAGTIAGEGEFNLESEIFSYLLSSSGIDLSKVQKAAGVTKFLNGVVSFTSSGAGTLKQPEIVLEGSIAQASLRGTELPAAAAPTFYLAIRNGELVVRASAFDVASVEGTGSVSPNGELDGLVQLSVKDVAQFLRYFAPTAAIPAEGSIVVDLRLGGNISSLDALEVTGTVPVMNLVVSGQQFTVDEPIAFAYRAGKIDIASMTLRRNGSTFSASGSISLVDDRRINVNINGVVEASLIRLVSPETRAEGQIRLAASIGGTIDKPRINGTAEIVDAEFKVPGFPQLIDDVTGSVVFEGDRVRIDSLRATIGGGTVVAGGFLILDGLSLQRLRFNVQGTDVNIRYFEGISVDGDFSLLVSGDTERAVVQGEVNVERALYYKDFDLQALITQAIVERRAAVPSVAAGWQENVALRIALRAPEALAIRNNIASVTGGAQLEVTGTLANPIVTGRVTIDEGGEVEFQDVDYRIVSGTIDFQNPFRIDPYFDITAEARVTLPTPTGEDQEYDLNVNLTGTLDRFTPNITSDPPAGDLTLLTLLGVGNFGGAGGAAPTLASVQTTGSSILLQTVGQYLGTRIFPFADSFRLDSGLTGGGSAPTATIEKRISNDLRVIFAYNLIDHTNSQVIEWQATKDWVLQFIRESEETNSYALDARFRRRYDGRWGGGNEEGLEKGSTPSEVADRSLPRRTASPPEPREGEPAEPAPTGAPVMKINYVTDTGTDVSSVTEYVSVEVGQPLSIRDVQRSISALYGTGEFRDIRVDAVDVAGGTELTFQLSLNYRISEVAFEGLLENDERISKDLAVDEGDVLSLNAVDRSAVAVQETLEKRGYLDATVDPETRFIRGENRAQVVFHIAQGEQARVGIITIEGSLGEFSDSQLRDQLDQKPGETYRPDLGRREAERIRAHLARKKYRRAEVRLAGEDYDAAAKTVAMRYQVEVGIPVKVEVTGVPRRSVRRLLPFRKDDEYSEDLIDRASDDIVETYQRRGHYQAAVNVEEKTIGNEFVVTFEVIPGPRYKIDEVIFDGNQQLSDKQLRKVITVSEPGFVRSLVARLLRRGIGVTPEALEDDADALESHFKLEGFTEARVGSPVATPKPDGTMDITFPIEEGPRTLVTSVQIEGVEQVKRDDLPDLILKEGDPLNPLIINEDLTAIRSFYGDRGYVEAQVSALPPRFSADKTSAEVAYKIAEGPKVSVGEVIVRGNTYTDRDVVTRTTDLETGEPFSYRALLDSQRNLYRRGIFQRVDVIPEKTGTALTERDIVVEVDEGKNLSVSGAIGYSSEDGVRGTAAIAHRNLFGTGRYLGLEARISAKDRNRYFLTYREPFVLDMNIPVQLTLFRTQEVITGTNFRSLGTFIEASRVVGSRTRWALRYEYELTRCVEDGGLCGIEFSDPNLPRSDQEIDISSVTPSFFWDTRNDPFNPSKGFLASTSVEYAFPFQEATADFLKSFTQGSVYRLIGKSAVVAVSGRIGLIKPGEDRGNEIGVPLPKRLFGGGDTSHRAFDLDQLGVFDFDGDATNEATLICVEDDPDVPGRRRPVDCREGGVIVALGGNASALLNIEFRFPVFSSLQGAVFFDAGNVWRSIEQMDFGDLRQGVGIGFRYQTPVGPIRFDVGYKLGAEDFEDPYAFFLTLGYPF